jgi:hypothetical protein
MMSRGIIGGVLVSQLLLSGCGPHTSKIEFSIPRDFNNGISTIYVSLDSGAYKKIQSTQINPNGVRASYIIFFSDGSFKAPVNFDQTLYSIYDFYRKNNDEALYGPRGDWGRYTKSADNIRVEVALCDHVPDCVLKLKAGTFDIVNDTTLKVDPAKQDNRFLFGESAEVFYKVDSLNLDFIRPSNAWHNKRDEKRSHRDQGKNVLPRQ